MGKRIRALQHSALSIVPLAVTVIALAISVTFGFWQSAKQSLENNVIAFIQVLVVVAFAILVWLFVFRYKSALHRETLIEAIGDMINEGNVLRSVIDSYDSPAMEWALPKGAQMIRDWEERMTRLVYKYYPTLISLLHDTSGLKPEDYHPKSRINLMNTIDNRLVRLRELLSLIPLK